MNKTLLIYLLAAVNFTHIVDFMLIMPFGEVLREQFSISAFQFSLLITSYTLSAGVVGLLAALVLDKIDRKTALSFSYIGFLFGTLLCGLSGDLMSDQTFNYYFLLASRCLTGAFGGILGAAIYTIAGDEIPLERRGWAMGIISAAFSLASIIGVPLGLYVSVFETLNWQTPFYVLAGLGTVILLLIILFVKRMRDHIDETDASLSKRFEAYSSVLKSANKRQTILFGMLLIMGAFTVIPFISPYLIRNLGFTIEDLPLLYVLGGLFTVLTNPMIGRIADQFGKKRVFMIVTALSIIPIYLFTNLEKTNTLIIYIISTVFFVFVSGRWVPANAIITSVVEKQSRGSFMSISNATQQLTLAFASFLAGLIIVEGGSGLYENYDIVGYIAISMAALSIYFCTRLKLIG